MLWHNKFLCHKHSQVFQDLMSGGGNTHFYKSNRPLLFISQSHGDNQSESTTKFYNSSNVDVGGNVLTLSEHRFPAPSSKLCQI